MGCPGKIRVETYLTPDEHQIIKETASQCGLSVASFLRKISLGTDIRSNLDNGLILQLVKVSADLGRVGGLLKLGLSEHKFMRSEVVPLLNQILKLKEVLEQKIIQL
jgi:hypothetical protein